MKKEPNVPEVPEEKKTKPAEPDFKKVSHGYIHDNIQGNENV